MINIIYIPQRSNINATYRVNNDILTIKINDIEEKFDFTCLGEGVAEEIIAEKLFINPIISARKQGDLIDVEVLYFYKKDEKYLYEVMKNG